MTTEQLVQARARAEVTHIYLEHGLLDEARAALAQLITELGGGLETNGWGSDVKTVAEPKAPRAAGPKAARKRRAATAAPRGVGTKSSVEGPIQSNGRRARRTFTEDQQRDTAARAREIGVAAAAREADVVPSLVRVWMRKFPLAGSPLVRDGE